MRYRALVVAALAVSLGGGCASTGSWGPQWPSGETLGQAAAGAATDPMTWVPLAGAAALAISGEDDDLARWAADEQPLFGDDAASASDDLRDAAGAAWLLTALAAPSGGMRDKAGGLLVGAGALAAQEYITWAIKEASGRRRPDDSDDLSFSSGHAAAASAASALALDNLRYRALPRAVDVPLRVGIHGLAIGSAWARVEARKHYPTDVLAGYAVGRFVALFVQRAFMQEPGASALAVEIQALPGGGALTVTWAAGPRNE